MKLEQIPNTQNRDQDHVETPEYIENKKLYRAIDRGNLHVVKEILNQYPEAATARLTPEGDTVLHVAVLSGHVEIVRELVNRIQDPVHLEAQNYDKDTALAYAATGDSVALAKYLVGKNEKLVGIRNRKGQLPIVIALLYGQMKMVRYLYRVTSIHDLAPGIDDNGATLMTNCIVNELFDIALEVAWYYPELSYARDCDKDTAICLLAKQPSSFPSSTRLNFWDRWIYAFIQINQTSARTILNTDIEKLRELPIPRQHLISLVPHLNQIFKIKLKHIQAKELLRLICQQIPNVGESSFAAKALFAAVENGIVEFVIEMSERNPDIIWKIDYWGRNIFLYAACQRQEKIFSLIYWMGGKTSMLINGRDNSRENLLHQAALLAPSSQLNLVAGAALQMQRELQWYQEVEGLLNPKYKHTVNEAGYTPRQLFSKEHKALVEEGEKWMKEVAGSCTVVAALVATMMFAAVFTVPGEYDEHGTPRFLKQNSFMLFIVSDALSLVTSTISILVFLRILTSRYKENDFLKSLPTKMMIGLFSLFFSMTTMMIAFGAALFIMLKERVAWAQFPIMIFSSLPVVFFAALQFPVLIDLFYFTYGPGIFDKPSDEPRNFSSWRIEKILEKY